MEDARDDSGGGGGGMTSFGRNLVGGCFKPNSTVASPGSSVVLTSNEVEDGEKSSADGLHGKELEKIPKEGSLSSASGFHGKELENIPKEGILGHHIIGSLTAQGQELLGIDEGRPSNKMIDVYQCFSVAEINHVVSLPGPINIKVSGLESLGKAPEVYRIINDKIKSHRKWRCPRLPLIHTLGKISDRIKQLHKVLPRVKVRNGNTKASAKALRTTAFIKKKARSLEKVIQGGAVAQVLCRRIETDQPHFLQLHSEELTEMAKEEYDSPVWFLPDLEG